ncbi:MAG TPA: helix-turn-helix transcriptional regulator [Anaerolineaceae bacterium]|nr:helix-turn-helix transcriptional regulator [Anaerolineaceae bacterium]
MGGGPQLGEHHSSLTISMLEPILLVLLKEKPRHGYTLLTELETLGVKSIHPSVVYRTLRELEGLEWIRSDWETDQTQGPPRRTYQLTERGEDAIQYWVDEMEKTRGLIVQLKDRLAKLERR